MVDENVIQAVSEVYGIPASRIVSRDKRKHVAEARKMVCYVQRELPRRFVARQLGLTVGTVRVHQLQFIDLMDTDELLQNKYEKITSKINKEMTIKITNTQLRALYAAIRFCIDDHLANHIADELIFLHLDEIAEKIRKRLRADKKNLSLDEKEQRAMVIWYLNYSELISLSGEQARHTLIDIINQIKPDERQYQHNQGADP